jgi:hypothetical protein
MLSTRPIDLCWVAAIRGAEVTKPRETSPGDWPNRCAAWLLIEAQETRPDPVIDRDSAG